jgi:hypothetical protein
MPGLTLTISGSTALSNCDNGLAYTNKRGTTRPKGKLELSLYRLTLWRLRALLNQVIHPR